MSKRGSKSTVKINNSKSISGGSGKEVAPWSKKKIKNISVSLPTSKESDTLKKLGLTFIYNPEKLEIEKLKFLVIEKMKDLSNLKKDLSPHKLNLDKKSKIELVRMIHILQNGIIDVLKIKL